MEEAWGFRELSSHHFTRKKAECSSLCWATRQLCDLVKVVLPWALVLSSLRYFAVVLASPAFLRVPQEGSGHGAECRALRGMRLPQGQVLGLVSLEGL